MAGAVVTRVGALWLACLLVFTPVGPLSLFLSAHASSDASHPHTVVHDASDHGISAGALGDHAPDRDCLFCQSASSLRLGLSPSRAAVPAPDGHSVHLTWSPTARPRDGPVAALPARAPPQTT